jgi:arabinan endo-1,5-alpha-L-arabinosidase
VAVYDAQNPPKVLTLSGNLGAHDPVVIEQNGLFYLHHTGMLLPGKTSNDLRVWNSASSALRSNNPSWVAPYGNPQDSTLWAPDLSYFGGQYHLYYSASSYESNKSCIGHATRASMTSGNWSDHGPVVCSNSNGSTDNWNAIDPNAIVDESGKAWLAFGSFWSGIKLIELDETGARANDNLHSIAARDESLFRLGGPIEAPYIVRRCGYYYLFVSFDFCCKGADSNYNIRVGRSEKVTGPYVDNSGTKMMEGGGTLLVKGNSNWPGAGHNAVIFAGNRAYNIYHAYTASNGTATLRVSEIAWDKDGWPISGGP